MNSSFINGLAEHIKSHYDLRKEALTVVFPNKRAAFYLRSKFMEIYEDSIWLPQMLSVEEAMTLWSGIQLVDTVDMLFELISIDSELFQKDNNVRVFGSMAAQMAKDFDEIDQYDVDADHLFSYIVDEKRIGLWHLDEKATLKERQYLEFFERLGSYYHLLRQRFESQGKGYYGMMTRQLAHLDDAVLVSRVNRRKVIFAGFNALTPTEQKIIDKLYRYQCAEVVWDFDRYYVEDPRNEAGYFARRYMEQNVPWKPKTFSDRLLSEDKEIHLIGVTGNTIQTKLLQSLLQVKVEDNSTVVLADENLMIPMLNAIPDDPRYPSVKVSMGYPLRQTALNDFVSEFFTLRRKGRRNRNGSWRWYIWPVLRIFDLELVRAVFSPKELKELESYKSYVRDKSVFLYEESEFNQCCQSEDLRRFMGLLLGKESQVTEPQELLSVLGELLAFVAYKVEGLGGAMLFLLNQVSETGKVVNRLKSILKRYRHVMGGLDELEILYRLVSDNTSVKLNSSAIDGLQVMGLLEARNLDFDTFYMVGVNEGILPAEKSSGSFIPYPIRKECGLPDYQEKQAVYAFHFYHLLQGAQRAFFIYNNNREDSGGEPSRFLLQLQYELAQRNPKVRVIEEVFANKTEKTNWPKRLFATKTGEVMALAPTSISTYLRCPLCFYLKYVMKLRDERVEEETRDNVIGSIVHDTLQRLFEPYLNMLVDTDGFKQHMEKELEGCLQKVISASFGQGLPDVGFNYLNRLTIRKLLENFMRYEKEEVGHHELYVLQVERPLAAQLEVNGVLCTITGKADRIDRCDGTIRVIDYKTGLLHDRDVKVPGKVESVRDIPEKALQLLIYKYLYLKEHPEVHPDEVTASLFGLKNQKVCFDLQVDYQPLLDDFIGTMDAFLTEVFASLMDRSVPFAQPEDPKVKPCHFCDFKSICANTVAGARLVNDR